MERWRVIPLNLPRTAVPSIAQQEVALTTKIVTDFYCVPADSFKDSAADSIDVAKARSAAALAECT